MRQLRALIPIPFKMTYITSLTLVLMTYLSSGCASLPSPPQGDTCVINAPGGYAICEPISAAVQRQHVAPHDSSNKVPISSMDNWVAFSPETWGSIETYILQLKDRAVQQTYQ